MPQRLSLRRLKNQESFAHENGAILSRTLRPVCAGDCRGSAHRCSVRSMSSAFAHLICTRCGAQYERDRRINVCPACGAALFARYHPVRIDRDALAARPHTIWRWSEMMPVEDPSNVVTLGE